MTPAIEAGSAAPLGATWDGDGVNFALFSANAERVELCLFGDDGRETRLELAARSGDVWHGRVAGLAPGARYGYRVHGPYAPHQGHRFNPHKLLLDPYARLLDGPVRWSDTLLGYRADEDTADLGFDVRDSAPFAPKGVVVASAETVPEDERPRTPWSETVIYEAHVRGLTRAHPRLPEPLRGTIAGLATEPVLAHLRELGVTAIELLPVHAFADEHFLLAKGLRNYWGYNSLGFLAPQPRYLGAGGLAGFRDTVRRLHEAGFEVLLDVVYNHTAEGSELGPTLCYRGIDNASYYRLREGDPRRYVNDTGCGNTLAVDRAPVRELVLASLRYWVQAMGVDGFRFDLGVTLGRTRHGFDPRSAFFAAVAADPVLRGVKLIAEPWDIGPGGYRLGGFPPGWGEWNDRFRDSVRRFWRGDPGELPELARRLHGSADLFDSEGRGPWASVNYVASHDGFTLADTAAYVERHNEANGERNHDGHHANFSDNLGHEGPTSDPAVLAARARRRRNLLASVMLAQGTPMLLAGDECGRTQRGNNNAYCQDNETNWFDWSLPDANRELLEFTRRLLALRRAHPLLRRPAYVHGATTDPVTGLADVCWLSARGVPMTPSDWQDRGNRFLAMLLAATDDDHAAAGDAPPPVLIVLNAGDEAVDFALPEGAELRAWRCELASTAAAPAGELQRLAVEAQASYVLVGVPGTPAKQRPERAARERFERDYAVFLAMHGQRRELDRLGRSDA